jgi:hypothetical protein
LAQGEMPHNGKRKAVAQDERALKRTVVASEILLIQKIGSAEIRSWGVEPRLRVVGDFDLPFDRAQCLRNLTLLADGNTLASGSSRHASRKVAGWPFEPGSRGDATFSFRATNPALGKNTADREDG